MDNFDIPKIKNPNCNSIVNINIYEHNEICYFIETILGQYINPKYFMIIKNRNEISNEYDNERLINYNTIIRCPGDDDLFIQIKDTYSFNRNYMYFKDLFYILPYTTYEFGNCISKYIIPSHKLVHMVLVDIHIEYVELLMKYFKLLYNNYIPDLCNIIMNYLYLYNYTI